MSDKYELWSWNEPNRQWLAVDSGSEAKVLEGVARRTAAAQKFGLWGAAFVGCKAGAGPTAPPAELGIDVVTEPESETQAGKTPAAADDRDPDEAAAQRWKWNQDCADLRMDAYYYGFDGTGERAVDLVLSAVATAGKGSHHTESWGEFGHVEQIQEAADAAAAEVRALRAGLDAARTRGQELYAALELTAGDDHASALVEAARLEALDDENVTLRVQHESRGRLIAEVAAAAGHVSEAPGAGWTCGVCFRPGSEHDTCPDCQHCPGYPHDYGCER